MPCLPASSAVNNTHKWATSHPAVLCSQDGHARHQSLSRPPVISIPPNMSHASCRVFFTPTLGSMENQWLNIACRQAPTLVEHCSKEVLWARLECRKTEAVLTKLDPVSLPEEFRNTSVPHIRIGKYGC